MAQFELTLRADMRGDILMLHGAGVVRRAGLDQIVGRLRNAMDAANPYAVVLDLRKVVADFTVREWREFADTAPLPGISGATPIAILVAEFFLPIGDEYAQRLADHDRVRCFFSEAEDAFSWLHWLRVRDRILPLDSALRA